MLIKGHIEIIRVCARKKGFFYLAACACMYLHSDVLILCIYISKPWQFPVVQRQVLINVHILGLYEINNHLFTWMPLLQDCSYAMPLWYYLGKELLWNFMHFLLQTPGEFIHYTNDYSYRECMEFSLRTKMEQVGKKLPV